MASEDEYKKAAKAMGVTVSQLKSSVKAGKISDAAVTAAAQQSSAGGFTALLQGGTYIGQTVYMPDQGENLVSKFNSLSQQLSDLRAKSQKKKKGGDLLGGGLSSTADAVEMQSIQAQMNSLKERMGKGETGMMGQKYEDVLGAPLEWSEKQLSKFINTGLSRHINGFAAGMGMPEVMDLWQNMVERSIFMSQASGKKYTPWDVMGSYGKKGSMGTYKQDGWVFDAATGERISYEGPRTKKATSKQVDLSDGEQVQALSRQILQEMLGRSPTDEEFARYKDTINSYESAHPLVTQSTQTLTDAEINAAIRENRDVDWSTATTTSKSTGGVTDAARQEILGDEIRDKPEYAKFQAGTTYWNAMLDVIGGVF